MSLKSDVTKARRRAAERKRGRREKSLSAKRRLRRAGSHWYELTGLFDDEQKAAVPVSGAGFVRGVLEDFVVVEIARSVPQREVQHIARAVSAMGLKTLIVMEGVRFLQLRECPEEQARELNEVLEKSAREKAKEGTDGQDAAGEG